MKFRMIAGCLAIVLAATGCSGGLGNSISTADGDLVIDGTTIASQQQWQAALDEGFMTLYDTYPEEQWREVLDVFTEDTGVEVDSVRLVTGRLYERMLSESGANRPTADALGITDMTLMADLYERGIVESFDSPTGKSLPADRFDPDGSWYVSMLPGLTISYNTEVVSEDEAPKTWEDLLDPKWQGKIGTTQISTGGSVFSLFYFLREKFGEAYWEALKAQQPRMYESSVSLGEDMVRGELPVTIGNPGVVASLIKDGAPVTMVFPDSGAPVFQNVVGLVKGAGNPAAAKLYLNWLLSPRGQQVIVEKTSEYPADPHVRGPIVEGVDMPAPDSPVLKAPPTEAWFAERTELTKDWYEVFT